MSEQLEVNNENLQQRVDEATRALRDKKEDAEKSSHDKSRFLAVASHDLRQPLHALGLYIAELQRKIKDEEIKHLVDKVENSVEALSMLLNDLLDISKLDAGAVVPKFQTCDISSLLERSTADYQMLARIKNIKLVVKCSFQYVTSDPILLERILINLLSNAIRYTPVHGTVFIGCRKRGDNLRIEIRDNGIGISKDDLENIFREFYQLTPSQFEVKKGLGLGLSIVERLINLLGHKLDVISYPQRGSTFAITIPAKFYPNFVSALPVTESNKAEFAQPNSVLLDKAILVVDDDAQIRQGTLALLASWGCKVTTAESLAEATRRMSEGVFLDIIVTDYELGNNETGFDVIEHARQFYEKLPPCILISGNTSSDLQKLVLKAGHHLLHKPVRPAKLISLMKFLLGDLNE
jgi:CheY-like chemotaxis protein